jgi:hypothetical protein
MIYILHNKLYNPSFKWRFCFLYKTENILYIYSPWHNLVLHLYLYVLLIIVYLFVLFLLTIVLSLLLQLTASDLWYLQTLLNASNTNMSRQRNRGNGSMYGRMVSKNIDRYQVILKNAYFLSISNNSDNQ